MVIGMLHLIYTIDALMIIPASIHKGEGTPESQLNGILLTKMYKRIPHQWLLHLNLTTTFYSMFNRSQKLV